MNWLSRSARSGYFFRDQQVNDPVALGSFSKIPWLKFCAKDQASLVSDERDVGLFFERDVGLFWKRVHISVSQECCINNGSKQ